MANGMAFNVTKGYSCRRNGMHVLGDSDMDSRLEEVTEYMRFGDSAYPHMAKITSRNSLDEFEDINRALNGCGISIEWMFRDATIFWKLVACKDILNLLDGFINCDNFSNLCFIFNNAHNCMNGNEISQ